MDTLYCFIGCEAYTFLFQPNHITNAFIFDTPFTEKDVHILKYQFFALINNRINVNLTYMICINKQTTNVRIMTEVNIYKLC
jgi:hypothetical protein